LIYHNMQSYIFTLCRQLLSMHSMKPGLDDYVLNFVARILVRMQFN
jgi:hypothetical protein